MTPRRAGAFLLLIFAFAAASWIGWWMVPAAALLWGALRPSRRRPAGAAALAAGIAAVAWLTTNAVFGGGSLALLNGRLAELIPVPVAALLAASVLIPALLAWSAVAVGSALRPGPTDRSQPTT